MKRHRRPLTLLCLGTALACAHPASRRSSDATSCPPRATDGPVWVLRAEPDSISAAAAQRSTAVITLIGCGFDATRNVVTIGPERVEVGAATMMGTRLAVTLPDAIRGGGEVPPMPIPAGDYAIVVETSRGRSNVFSFRLF
jgi:hypothetical protein